MPRKKAAESGNGEATGNGIGHNGATTELTASERRALTMFHFRKIQAKAAVCAEHQAEYKQLRKQAKADGITLADIDFAMRCADVDDASIIPAELSRRIEIAQWFALPVGSQAVMDFEREPVNDRAKREGTAAYYAGLPREPTSFAADSRPGQTFIKAWDAAQSAENNDLASALQKQSAVRDLTADAEMAAEAEEAAMPPE